MIDLHLHTTASDGQCGPEELIARARSVGLSTVAVSDHDTLAALPAAEAAATQAGLVFVPGIEITSVWDGRDVHVLGYFLEPGRTLQVEALIAGQRHRRVERAREIAAALGRMGAPIDVEPLIAGAAARTGKAVGRPQIARALVSAGHVGTVAEAFDRYLGESGPAYVPHTGAPPSEAVAAILSAAGTASLAHPGPLNKDHLIADLAGVGLGALEAYHPAHDPATTGHYVSLARRFDLAVTGGSDYHGEGVRRAEFFGVTHLPAEEFARFLERAGRPA